MYYFYVCIPSLLWFLPSKHPHQMVLGAEKQKKEKKSSKNAAASVANFHSQ
jgi:hypothetical protein